MDPKTQANIDSVKSAIIAFEDKPLTMELGYEFRTKEFLNVLFLYINSVDVRNPDILGRDNKNTFFYEPRQYIAKIKEQIRLDIKDLNFNIPGATALARFVPKAANRKVLKDNNFDEVMDEIPDNAADFGSGFLKVWTNPEDQLKAKSVDPYFMIFDQRNFKKGKKIEAIPTTPREVIDNEKYDEKERQKLKDTVDQDCMDDQYNIYQSVQDFPDGTQQILIIDKDHELQLYEYTTKKGEDKLVRYYKFDYQKRKGFPDALGVGCNEMIFNKLVQSKVNRERMDRVMEVASTLAFQKQIDNEQDNMVGQTVIDLEPSVILGHKGNPLSVLDTGGMKQASMITGELNKILQTIGNDLSVSEALAGNTMPSGTSGVLGNLLTENSSSVLKEVKKDYAKFLNRVYETSFIPYMLEVFDSSDDLRKYLEPNDIKLIEKSVINHIAVQKQIDSVLETGRSISLQQAVEEARQEQKGKPLISGELLDQLREEMSGIQTFISGENISKAQAVAFIRELRSAYASNPAIFQDPFFIEALKMEAEYDAGISALEIDNLLRELPQQTQDLALTQ